MSNKLKDSGIKLHKKEKMKVLECRKSTGRNWMQQWVWGCSKSKGAEQNLFVGN